MTDKFPLVALLYLRNKMDQLFKKTKVLTHKCIGIMGAYIAFAIILTIINNQPAILGYASDTFISGSFFQYLKAIGFILIVPFFHAGFYSITFLKIHSQETGLRKFFLLANENYWSFFKITIAEIFLGCLYWVFFRWPYIYVFALIVLPFFVELFFVLAYPFAIVGYFSNRNLEPIKSSFKTVIKDFKKIRYIIALLTLKFSISTLIDFYIRVDYYNRILHLLLTPVSFIVLIMSYILITDQFYSQSNFDFKKYHKITSANPSGS